MFEADTTYLWQTPFSVDAKTLCASAPVSLSQAQSKLNFNHHCTDMGIPVPASAFFAPGKRSSVVHFSTN